MRRLGLSTCLFVLTVLLPFQGFAQTKDVWNGEDYAKNSSSQKEAASDLLKHVSIKGDERILDVGCGDGKITAEIAQKYPGTILEGIDISTSMIEFARTKFPTETIPNLQFRLLNGQDLDYPGNIDLILSFTALQWIPSHSQFLDRAHASLKTGGILAISMPLEPPKALDQAVQEIMAQPEWAPYFKDFSTGWNFVNQQEYKQLLTEKGFVTTRYAIVLQKDVFPSRQAFEGFLTQIFPYLRPLPSDLKKPFLTLVIDRFLELESFPRGEVHWKFPRLEVIATKGE